VGLQVEDPESRLLHRTCEHSLHEYFFSFFSMFTPLKYLVVFLLIVGSLLPTRNMTVGPTRYDTVPS
jgi:hypothetical protein